MTADEDAAGDRGNPFAGAFVSAQPTSRPVCRLPIEQLPQIVVGDGPEPGQERVEQCQQLNSLVYLFRRRVPRCAALPRHFPREVRCAAERLGRLA
jgi:hypothetical protein